MMINTSCLVPSSKKWMLTNLHILFIIVCIMQCCKAGTFFTSSWLGLASFKRGLLVQVRSLQLFLPAPDLSKKTLAVFSDFYRLWLPLNISLAPYNCFTCSGSFSPTFWLPDTGIMFIICRLIKKVESK